MKSISLGWMSMLTGVLCALSLLLPWYAPFWAPGLLFGLLIAAPLVRTDGAGWIRTVLAVMGSVLAFITATLVQGTSIAASWHPIVIFGIAGLSGGGILALFCFGLLSFRSWQRIFVAAFVGGLAGLAFGALLFFVRTNGLAWIAVMAVSFVIWQAAMVAFVFRQQNIEVNPEVRIATSVLVCLLVYGYGDLANAASPKLVAVSPDAEHVSATTSEFIFEFDQDMDPDGKSLQGVPRSMPQVRGDLKWQTPKQLIVPVQLEPNRMYVLGGNVQGRLRLRNLTGEFAEPFVSTFRVGEPASVQLVADLNREAIDELRELLDRRYSYRDVHRVDWDAQFAAYDDRLVAAQHPDEFAMLCTALLQEAGDGHLWVWSGDMRLPTTEGRYTPNYNWQTLKQIVPGWRDVNPLMITGQFPDRIRYLAVPTLYMQYHTALQSLGKVWSIVGSHRLILDLRMNSGGAEPIGMLLAGCLVDGPRVYAQHRSIGEDGQFRPVSQRVLRPTLFAPRQTGKVAVLIGPQNVSSCESFVMMIRQCENARLFGQPTRGSSGNPKRFRLANGVSVSLPSWQAMDADGNVIEGVGIQPDEIVNATAEEFEHGDPVLDAALSWLRQGR